MMMAAPSTATAMTGPMIKASREPSRLAMSGLAIAIMSRHDRQRFKYRAPRSPSGLLPRRGGQPIHSQLIQQVIYELMRNRADAIASMPRPSATNPAALARNTGRTDAPRMSAPQQQPTAITRRIVQRT